MFNHNFDDTVINEITYVKVEATIYRTALNVNFLHILGGIEVLMK